MVSTVEVNEFADEAPAPFANADLRVPPNASESYLALAATMLLAFAGGLSQGVSPFIVNGLLSYASLSRAQAGLCVSAEMTGSVLGGALVLFLLVRIRRRPVAVAALLTVIVGNFSCLAATGVLEYATARFVAGIGCGLTTTAYGILAASRLPGRNFAIFTGLAVLLLAAFNAVTPYLFALGGIKALFLLIAGLAIVALMAAAWIPERRSSIGPALASNIAAPLRRRSAALLGSTMNIFYFSALAAFWTYVAEIGASRGAGTTAIAAIISSGFLLAGTSASLVAAIATFRANNRRMIAACTIASAITVAATILSTGLVVFAAAVLSFIFLWFFTYPFIMGMLSEIDRSGRLAVVGLLLQNIGWVIGPAIGGIFIARSSHAAFGAVCSGGFLATLVCALAIKPTSLVERKASIRE